MTEPDPYVIALYDQLMAQAREAFPETSEAWRETWFRRLYWYMEHDGDMTGAPEFPDVCREQAASEAWERMREEYCVTDHQTWASLARCLWPSHRVLGEGPWALVTAAQVRLYGPDTPLVVGSSAVSVVHLDKGPHRRGEGWTP